MTADDRPPAELLTCHELVELVTDYLEGVLSSEDRRRFEEHLDECEPCRFYLEQMRKTIDALGRLRAEQLDPTEQQQLLNLFRNWKG